MALRSASGATSDILDRILRESDRGNLGGDGSIQWEEGQDGKEGRWITTDKDVADLIRNLNELERQLRS